MNGGTLRQYKDYRLFVISRLPKLLYLDDEKVKDEERERAVQKYGVLPMRTTSSSDLVALGGVSYRFVRGVDADVLYVSHRRHVGTRNDQMYRRLLLFQWLLSK